MAIRLRFILPSDDDSPKYDHTIDAEHVPDVGETVGIQIPGDKLAIGKCFRLADVERRKWYVQADGVMTVECWLADDGGYHYSADMVQAVRRGLAMGPWHG